MFSYFVILFRFHSIIDRWTRENFRFIRFVTALQLFYYFLYIVNSVLIMLTRMCFRFLRFIILLQLLITEELPCIALKCKLWRKLQSLTANIPDENRLMSHIYPTSSFLNTYKSCKYDIVHNGPVHFSVVMLDWCRWNIHAVQELLENFFLLDMSEVILVKLISVRGVKTSVVELIRVEKLFAAVLWN